MQRTGDRPLRIAALVQRELAALLRCKVGDPVIAGAIISGVEVTRDLSLAKVYLLLPENADDAEADVLERFNRASGFLRHALSKRLQLRKAISLRFFGDDMLRRSARVEQLLLEGKQR